jgi:hypothetical protein
MRILAVIGIYSFLVFGIITECDRAEKEAEHNSEFEERAKSCDDPV